MIMEARMRRRLQHWRNAITYAKLHRMDNSTSHTLGFDTLARTFRRTKHFGFDALDAQNKMLSKLKASMLHLLSSYKIPQLQAFVRWAA
jgi:hypothetical protein